MIGHFKPGGGVQIDMNTSNAQELIRDALAAGVENLKGAATRAVATTILQGRDVARLSAPVDTGKLRESIAVKGPMIDGSRITGEVVAGAEYATYVEFGTGQRGDASQNKAPLDGLSYKEDWAGMAARPYMYPAAVFMEKQLVENVKAELNGGGQQ